MKWVVERLFRRSAGEAEATLLPYRAFTQSFDREIEAENLDAVLGPLSRRDAKALEEAWQAFQGGLLSWRTALHLKALEAAEAIRRSTTDRERDSTVVSILVDQSGSMRGQSMLLAAAACDVAQDFIGHLGCKVEVLGFTTTTWRGGKARRRWKYRLRPRYPGRLCELLHIVYKSADDSRASTMGWIFRPMLRPDLPKENVDGEALQWASTRLVRRPESRKILVVISDGAPVDDATLAANDLGILDRHLRSVIRELEIDGVVDVAAVGLGFDVSSYYSRSVVVNTADDLGDALIGLLERTLCRARETA